MKSKRIMTMQDLSCVGQCSLTVALPILSAYGVETCVLPTAVLSNHTMFKSWSYLDLTPEIKNIFAYWEKNEFKFEGFLLGYLGKKELMDIAEEAFDRFSFGENAPKIIDPCFGDNGALYGGFDKEYVKAMRNLLRRADIILPNITEASFLTDCEYREYYDKSYVEKLIRELKKLCGGVVVITGVEFDGKIGEAIAAGDGIQYVLGEKLPVRYHGTGDIFAAVFAAKYLAGETLAEACRAAGEFVVQCLKNTDKEHFYGVNFESVLNNRK